MSGRGWRQTGRVGDVYHITYAEARLAPKRVGGAGNSVELEAFDIALRVAHSGDCFGHFKISRDGVDVGHWHGYDLFRLCIGNVVDDIEAGAIDALYLKG